MLNTRVGSVAKIVKLEHAWRRLDGRNDDGFQVAPFQGDVILWAVRWYCRYPISYRDLEEMLAERGISVDHTTIYRWVQCYAPEMEKRLRWFWRRGFDPSWRLDETYVKVRGKWTYLYRAVDKRGDTIDFYLSPTRSAKAAKRFLGKALRGLKHWEKPATLNTDKAPSYGAAITELKGTVAKLAMRQPFVLFKGLTFQKLCLPGAFRPGDHHNKMLRPGLCVVHASPQYL